MKREASRTGAGATVFLSALMLWLVAALGAMQGLPSGSPLDAAKAANGAARSGDLPTQQSTPVARHPRLAVLSDRFIEQNALASHDAGDDPALVPASSALILPPIARTAAIAPIGTIFGAPIAGFRARAPPILV